LRYEVYCNEQQFLAPEDYPSRLEIDSYDDHAIHVGAINREGVLVGTLRLVLPSAQGFPLLEHCELFDAYKYLADPANQAQIASVEISRLAVSKSYRRRANDGLYGLAETEDKMARQQKDGAAPHRRNRPELVLGLYRAMYQFSKRQGITHWLAAMEKTLLRLLHRYQFGFKPIGPEVDYYGPVTPYLAEIAQMEEGVRQRHPELFAQFAQGLAPEFLPVYPENGN
jgi:N-acyl amino acid synthase of PEP-CTERM/exosortase system